MLFTRCIAPISSSAGCKHAKHYAGSPPRIPVIVCENPGRIIFNLSNRIAFQIEPELFRTSPRSWACSARSAQYEQLTTRIGRHAGIAARSLIELDATIRKVFEQHEFHRPHIHNARPAC